MAEKAKLEKNRQLVVIELKQKEANLEQKRQENEKLYSMINGVKK